MGKTDKEEKTTKKQKHFWKDFKAELKKVIWPTRSQVVNNTIVVIVIVLIVTAIVFVLDLAFEALNTYGIDKLKALVQDSVTSSQDENNGITNNETTDNNVDTNSSQEENGTQNNEANDVAGNDVADDVANVNDISE